MVVAMGDRYIQVSYDQMYAGLLFFQNSAEATSAVLCGTFVLWATRVFHFFRTVGHSLCFIFLLELIPTWKTRRKYILFIERLKQLHWGGHEVQRTPGDNSTEHRTYMVIRRRVPWNSNRSRVSEVTWDNGERFARGGTSFNELLRCIRGDTYVK